jgi:hypothetical protein
MVLGFGLHTGVRGGCEEIWIVRVWKNWSRDGGPYVFDEEEDVLFKDDSASLYSADMEFDCLATGSKSGAPTTNNEVK